MSEPYFRFPSEVDCPFCGEPDQCLEDLGDTPFYLSGDCSMCNKSFAYDCGRNEYYDDKGNVVKPFVTQLENKEERG